MERVWASITKTMPILTGKGKVLLRHILIWKRKRVWASITKTMPILTGKGKAGVMASIAKTYSDLGKEKGLGFYH